MYSYGTPHMAEQKQDDQLEHTYSSYMWIRDVVLKTCQRRWTIRRSGERGSGISVLAVRHDDDDDDDILSNLSFEKIQIKSNYIFCTVALLLSGTINGIPVMGRSNETVMIVIRWLGGTSNLDLRACEKNCIFLKEYPYFFPRCFKYQNCIPFIFTSWK